METVTLKLDRRHVDLLRKRARASGRSQGAVVRDLIEQHLGKRHQHLSLHDRAQDLCGSVSGPRDLSTRRPSGYGRD